MFIERYRLWEIWAAYSRGFSKKKKACWGLGFFFKCIRCQSSILKRKKSGVNHEILKIGHQMLNFIENSMFKLVYFPQQFSYSVSCQLNWHVHALMNESIFKELDMERKVAYWQPYFWGFLVTWDNNITNSNEKNMTLTIKRSSYSVLGTGISPGYQIIKFSHVF